MSQMAAMKMSRFLPPRKAHSAKNNDAFTHCGISLISPNTLHQKYSGSLKISCFSLIFYTIGEGGTLFGPVFWRMTHIYGLDIYTVGAIVRSVITENCMLL